MQEEIKDLRKSVAETLNNEVRKLQKTYKTTYAPDLKKHESLKREVAYHRENLALLQTTLYCHPGRSYSMEDLVEIIKDLQRRPQVEHMNNLRAALDGEYSEADVNVSRLRDDIERQRVAHTELSTQFADSEALAEKLRKKASTWESIATERLGSLTLSENELTELRDLINRIQLVQHTHTGPTVPGETKHG